jgi:DNA polymerase sigma
MQFLAERSLDKPYLGGLSSYGLLLLVLRFMQAQEASERQASAAGSPPPDASERSLGARLVQFFDFYGHHFEPRSMGVSVTRNRGEGECAEIAAHFISH